MIINIVLKNSQLDEELSSLVKAYISDLAKKLEDAERGFVKGGSIVIGGVTFECVYSGETANGILLEFEQEPVLEPLTDLKMLEGFFKEPKPPVRDN